MVFSYNRTDDFDLMGTDLAYDDHTETVAEIRAQPTQWDGLILNHAIPLGTYAKSCFCFRRMTGQWKNTSGIFSIIRVHHPNARVSGTCVVAWCYTQQTNIWLVNLPRPKVPLSEIRVE